VEISESRDGEVNILAPKGSLNTQTSPRLEEKLSALLADKGRLVVIDFKAVDYLSSAALRVLLMVTRRLARVHGQLVLCAMSEDLKKVFAISGFDRDFTILATRGEAVAVAAATPPPPAEPEARAGGAKPRAAEARPAAQTPPLPEPAPKAEPPAPAVAEPVDPRPDPLAPILARAREILEKGEASPPWRGWHGPGSSDELVQRALAIVSKGL